MKLRKRFILFLTIFAFLIVLNFVMHVIHTNAYNQGSYTISSGEENGACSFSFGPQNNNEISWTRATNFPDKMVELNACSYDGKLKNTEKIEISEWTMRIDITQDCYVNSAWCGLVEIHQHVGGEEISQTLDLRAIDPDMVELDFLEDGDIFLFPLEKGDYLIYHPNEIVKEYPIAAIGDEAGEVGIGMIFYWNQETGALPLTTTVTYRLHKNYFQGSEAVLALVTLILWVLLFAVFLTIQITRGLVQKRTSMELEKKEIEKNATEHMLEQMIRALANSIDAKDEYTHGHSERVAEYSLKLAQALQLSNQECKEVFYAGLVHDMGKIAIPSAIINKPGRLTDDEFAIIKSHPVRGEKILCHIDDMPYLAVGAKYHHERYDGLGYPDHKKGEEIPLLARIIAVADAYDAMTSHRSYRNTLNQNIVKHEIWKGMGTQFDPLIAKHMIAMIDADVGYNMREKADETYGMIDRVNTNEFWEEYTPKSRKSEQRLMADTKIEFFAQFLLTVDHWLDPIKLAYVTTSVVEKSFHSVTKADAQYIWNTPIVILYSSPDGVPASENYKELAVLESSGYSWKTGETISEEITTIRKEAFCDWNYWMEKNKEGLDYTVKVQREEDVVSIILENELISVKQRVVLPKQYSEPLYLCVSGEHNEIQIQDAE